MVLVKRRSRQTDECTRTPLKSLISYGDGYTSTSTGFSPISTRSPESCTSSRFLFNDDELRKRKNKSSSLSAVATIAKVAVCLIVFAFIGQSVLVHPFGRASPQDKLGKLDKLDKPARRTTMHSPVVVTESSSRISSNGQILTTKMESIHDHIQADSRRTVIKKFGSGPHKVRFTVEFTDDKQIGSFVMEMAPLSLMPHSVHAFLTQVSLKLWDRTVFWHHEGIDHIISAAAVMYETGEPRHHHFGAFGVGGLSYSEYSAEFPHEMYTVGFAGRGPEFYINARNNTELHGPGGQQHAYSKRHADPCFAKIVEGIDVVRHMYRLSVRQSREAIKRREWHDNELTHILKAEILR